MGYLWGFFMGYLMEFSMGDVMGFDVGYLTYLMGFDRDVDGDLMGYE